MKSRHLIALGLFPLLFACSSDDKEDENSGSSSSTAPLGGPVAPSGPSWNLAGAPLFANPDPHAGGTAAELRIAEMLFGRLVDVYAIDPADGVRRLAVRDFFIGTRVGDRPGAWTLGQHATTGKAYVTVPHASGSSSFKAAIQALAGTPQPPAVTDAGTFGPNPVFLRDAAVSIRFDDLLDPDSLYEEGVRLTVGEGMQLPYDARIIADAHHGGFTDHDGDGQEEFYPTRLVIGATKSFIDVVRDTTVGTVNPLGLPAALEAQEPNVVLRLATQADAANPLLVPLANLSGNTLATAGQGPVDTGSATIDILRVYRSGKPGLGPNRGFMRDDVAPRLLGTSSIRISRLRTPPAGIGGNWTVDLLYSDARSFHAPRTGEIIAQPRVSFEILRDGSDPGDSGVVRDVLIAPLAGNPRELTEGSAVMDGPFDPILDAGRIGSFFAITPGSADHEASIQPSSLFTVRFNEPIDASTADPFETFRLTRVEAPSVPDDFVVGQINVFGSANLMSFVPALPLSHEQGTGEKYFVRLAGGASGLEDVKGNRFASSVSLVVKTDPTASSESTGGFALRFNSADEDADGAPEVRGQHLALGSGQLVPRPVARFSAVTETSHPIRTNMIPFSPGLQAPLSPLGSRTQLLWRYADLGWELFDEALFNVDVEGLHLSPRGGSITPDNYERFEIALAHGRYFPDEAIDPGTLFPFFPQSGLSLTFADNAVDGMHVVHPRERGYSITPALQSTSASGMPLVALPLNRGIPASEFRTYTWRDTALESRAASGGGGLDPLALANADPSVTAGGAYSAGNVPSIGLPLLMDFRCFPDANALGVNSFDVSLAVNSSLRPHFRTQSTGGISVGGQIIVVDPDQATTATGGFNPATGGQTSPGDIPSYLGQMDLVLRVSRVHSRWFDTDALSPQFIAPTIVAATPAGTRIELAFRGASFALPIAMDASEIDFYGDAPVGSIAFGPLGESWTEDISDLDGQRYIQTRISFIGDLETLATAELDGLGFAWSE